MKKSKIENSLVLFFFLPGRHFILPEGACGEGISKGNIVPLGPPVGVRDPLRRGPGFLLLFSIKSKKEILCFAEKVLNGRNTPVVQANFWRDCAHPMRSTANLFADAPTRVAFSLQKSLFYAIIEQKL